MCGCVSVCMWHYILSLRAVQFSLDFSDDVTAGQLNVSIRFL